MWSLGPGQQQSNSAALHDGGDLFEPAASASAPAATIMLRGPVCPCSTAYFLTGTVARSLSIVASNASVNWSGR